ncbi:MAG TPA: tetratricopeptide repeat protein [Desulfuromonadaceae bacterium]|jgi:hypothetical protein
MRTTIFLLIALCCPVFFGQALATYFDGMEAYRQNDYQTALREFKATGEDVKAIYMIGVMYEKGEGLTVDYAEAANWYRKAAEKGSAAGQYRLGRLYERGQGVEQNNEEAIKLYKKAARQGNPDAKQALKRMESK